MRIRCIGADIGPEVARVSLEEFTNYGPIGIGGGGATLIAAGIAIDFDVDEFRIERGDAF